MNDFNKSSMKTLTIFCILNLFLLGIVNAQDCKVKKESIAGSYEGGCKKGLAQGVGTATGVDTYTGDFKKGLPHGTGTYSWAGGNVYQGEFKNGMMDGAGEMTVTIDGNNGGVTTGFWEKDKYLGKYKDAYVEHSRSSKITSVRVSEVKNPKEGVENALFVTFTERGANVFDQSITIEVSVGSHALTQSTGRATRINVVEFPYRAVLNYRGERVDVEIYKKGIYDILIDTNF